MLKHLGLDGWQAWDYAIARLYKRTETAEGVSSICDVCGSPNGNEHGEACPIAIAEALMARELRKCQAGHRMHVVYVAGRFRAPDGWSINENVYAAEKAGREVAALGAMPLIPHSIGAHMAGTEDDTFWLTGTLELMRRCDAVLVLPGYQESQGTLGEIAEAQRIGLPVIMPLGGAPGWEELRSWFKKPKATVTFDGKEVRLMGFARFQTEIGKSACRKPVDDLQEARDRHDKVAAIAEKLHKQVEDQARELDELRARTIRERDRQLQAVQVERDSLQAEVTMLRAEHKHQYLLLRSLRSLVNAGPDEALDVAIGKVMMQIKQLTSERDSLRTEVTMLREELKTQKDEREEDQKELAELAIELGQQVGERLITAARRVRKMGTHAEVKRLNKLCEFYLANLKERANQLINIAMALGEHDGLSDEEAARALVKERDELAANLDTQRTEVRKLQAVLALCRNERDLVAKELRADKEAFASDATRVRLALESEVKDLKDRLGAATAELAIITKRYDEALELCDRDGMTPTEQIKELRKELEDIRPEAEQMAGWRQSSLNRQVEIQNLQDALAEEKKQRQDFVAALCAELGVQCGERTAMAAVEQMKAKLQAPRKAIVIPHRLADFEASNLARALPLMQPSEPAPSSEASHITHAGEEEVKKALTRPVYSSCTCHLDAPCSHCTWYSDRGLDDPNEVVAGLVMRD